MTDRAQIGAGINAGLTDAEIGALIGRRPGPRRGRVVEL